MVEQNTRPLSADYVVGFNRGSFITVGQYSYILTANETATDVIGEIDLPYQTPNTGTGTKFAESNLYVGRLVNDGSAWLVDPRATFGRKLHISCLSGEYILLSKTRDDEVELKRRSG